MKEEIKVPSVGESITTGVIVTWLKQNGDSVQDGDILFELETDKAVLEIPSTGSGTLKILVDEGTEVAIGQTVAMLGDGQAAAKPSIPTEVEAGRITKEDALRAAEEQKLSIPPVEETAAPAPSPPPAQPAAEPSAVEPKPQAGGERHSERVPMSRIRKRTADRLVQATQSSAYLTTFNEIDMQKVIDIRTHYKAQFEKDHGIKIGFMSFFVKACCQALKEYACVNTEIDGTDIIYKYFYDIGVAVSIEEGLIVPNIRGADKLHFAEIEAMIASLAKRARDKKLLPAAR